MTLQSVGTVSHIKLTTARFNIVFFNKKLDGGNCDFLKSVACDGFTCVSPLSSSSISFFKNDALNGPLNPHVMIHMVQSQ